MAKAGRKEKEGISNVKMQAGRKARRGRWKKRKEKKILQRQGERI